MKTEKEWAKLAKELESRIHGKKYNIKALHNGIEITPEIDEVGEQTFFHVEQFTEFSKYHKCHMYITYSKLINSLILEIF